jgi:hypothetical protein
MRTLSVPLTQIFPNSGATIPKLRTAQVRRPLPAKTSKTSDARASATDRPSCELPMAGCGHTSSAVKMNPVATTADGFPQFNLNTLT